MITPNFFKRNSSLLIVLLVFLLAACRERSSEPVEVPVDLPRQNTADQTQTETANLPVIEPVTDISPEEFVVPSIPRQTPANPFVPGEANYYQLIDETLNLTPQELEMLSQNGFVLSDRLVFEDFTMAYAYIFWKDMPVLITTDSLLQVIHQNYDDILKQVEIAVITPRLFSFLEATRNKVLEASFAEKDPEMTQIYDDLIIYLTVPMMLLNEAGSGSESGVGYTFSSEPFIEKINAADAYETVSLFGGEPRLVDYSRFKPRGHYNENEWLSKYFQAVTWLGQIDFRLLKYDPLTSEPSVQPGHIAAAAILQQAIEDSGQRSNLDELDLIFTTLVGRSDNTVLSDLEQFLADAAIVDPSAVIAEPATEQWLDLLTTNDYGQQRITGQIINRNILNDSAVPIGRPVSFLLLGQRFAIDSYISGNLVYDRLLVNGEIVERPLPNPLEIMYALGNNQAAPHLVEEINQYGHQNNLVALQTIVNELPADYWTDSIYNRWLGILRTLNMPTTGPEYPQVMQTSLWADKMLHTQLASWSQLRHDNLLYVKQPYTTAQVLCEFPAAYVEPYPAFYTAVRDYAEAGQSLFELIASSDNQIENWFVPEIKTYYSNLAEAATYLEGIAQKELVQEPMTEDEAYFLQSIVRRPESLFLGCGGEPAYKEQWDGWYVNLFVVEDESPALVADIHTNPTMEPASRLFPPSVLHVGTGAVTTVLFIAETAEGPTMFVGPAFTYYEAIEYGDAQTAPNRMNDQEWVTRLNNGEFSPPDWTAGFRLPGRGEYLTVPLVPLSELHSTEEDK